MINFKKYGKRCLSLFLAASMILMPSVQTFAEEETAADTTDSTQTEEEDRETQRQNCYAIAPDSNSVENLPQGPATYADSAIVMDMNSGAVLYSKQIEKKHYPASITKLLTTLVALDNAELTDTVEFSQDSISFLEYGDAHIGMTPGSRSVWKTRSMPFCWHRQMRSLMQWLRVLARRWVEVMIHLFRR